MRKPLKLSAFVAMAQASAVAVLVSLAVWAATSPGYFWPGWVILGVVLNVAITARWLFGGWG